MTSEDICLETTWEYFKTYAESKKLSSSQIKNYKWRISYVCRIIGKDFVEIEEKDVNVFNRKMGDRIRRGEITQKTLRALLFTCDSFADYLKCMGVVNDTPFRRLKKPVISDVPYSTRIPNAEECDQILFAAEQHGDAMFLIFVLALRMGMSAGEICNLKTSHLISFDGKYAFSFPSKYGNNNDRYCKIPDDVVDVVLRYLPSAGEEYFFVNRMHKKMVVATLDKRVRQVMATAGEGYRKFTLKDLRNRAIFQMLHDGAKAEDVSAYLGLSGMRIETYTSAPYATSQALSCCPADMSRLKIM